MTLQQSLEEFGGGIETTVPRRKILGIDPEHMADALENFGLGNWFGRDGTEVPGDDFYRTQRVMSWDFFTRGDDKETDIGTIVVRTLVNTKGPAPDALSSRVKSDVLRAVALWDTGPYSGFLEGFGPINMGQSADENEPISAGEATRLGVPQHFLIVRDEKGNVMFEGQGIVNVYDVIERVVGGRDDDLPPIEPTQPPKQEQWRIGKQAHRERGDYYELRPETSAGKDRLADATHKTVYINGMPVGTPQASRGTVRIKNEFSSGDTYGGNYSRRGVIANSGATASSIRDGGLVYKIGETADKILLSTTRPSTDWDPETITEYDPDRDAGAAIGGSEPRLEHEIRLKDTTPFIVEQDNVLGKYAPEPYRRDIDTERWL